MTYIIVATPVVNPSDPLDIFIRDVPGIKEDWVGLYPANNRDNTQYSNSARIPAGVQNHVQRFTMPTQPGDYVFRFMLNESYETVAQSSPVQVKMPAPSLVAGPNFVSTGQPVSATVQNIAYLAGITDDPRHWLGLFRSGVESAQGIERIPQGVSAHIWTLQSLPLGTWHFRFFPNGSFAPSAWSNEILVTESVSPPVENVVQDYSNVWWDAGPVINGRNYSSVPTPQFDGVTFSGGEVDYLTTPVQGPLPYGGMVRLTFSIKNGPLVGSTGSHSSGVFLHIQRHGDTWSGKGVFNAYRLWSREPVFLSGVVSGTFSLAVLLTEAHWSGVETDVSAAQFQDTLANAAVIGLTFLDDLSKGHGNKGNATIEILQFTVHGP